VRDGRASDGLQWGGADTGASSIGNAVVSLADSEWRIAGQCDGVGDDLTFTGLGDPTLNIGINTAGTASAVGNFSSQKEGFIILVGTDEAPKPTVTSTDNSYSVTGTFAVPGETLIDGTITVTCD
jgi:hypothetical protein